MKIGITGGIATGKTLVAELLEEKGAYVIDADNVSHQILKKGETGWQKVVDEFGREILQENGTIDRRKLGKIVFSEKEKRKKLESITHPLIIKRIEEEIKNKEQEVAPNPVVVEVPLLYEAGMENKFDQIWVVYTEKEVQLERIQKRDKLSYREAEKRIDSQLSLEKKKKWADIVIENSGEIKEVKKQVDILWEHRIRQKNS